MKSSPLLLTTVLFALSPFIASAQNRPGLPVSTRPGVAPGSTQASADLKRFDLDFPGGTPADLAAAISKATDQHLNLIIPAGQAATKIMPMKVVNVTVSDLINAIQQASARQVPLVTGSNPGSRQVQYQKVSLSFLPVSGSLTDETVWAFQSGEPTAEDKAVLAQLSESEQVCKYFQLAPYLDDHTVEDITTAVETGWKMLGVDPMPKLSFHQDTKLLIAVGPAEQVEQIPAVLQQIPLDRSAAEEKIAKAMAEIDALKKAMPPGWEKNVEEVEQRMARFAQTQRAKEQLQQLMAQPGVPVFSRPSPK
jgi:hypothetical protein